jgi:hypothetical protein
VDEPVAIKLLLQFLYEEGCEPQLQPSSISPDIRLPDWDLHTCDVSNMAGRRRRFAMGECGIQLCEYHLCGWDCPSDCCNFTCAACAQASQAFTDMRLADIADSMGDYSDFVITCGDDTGCSLRDSQEAS